MRNQLPVEQNNLLILRLPRRRICVEAKTLQSVVEERTPNLDLRFASPHAVVQSDDFRLRFRQFRVGDDLQRDLVL
jgi:hypothetical protein